MDALLYLFPFQIFLLGTIIVTLLGTVLMPSSIFKRKKMGWLLLLFEIILLGGSLWYHIQPKTYERVYLNTTPLTFKSLKKIATEKGFYIGAAASNRQPQKDQVQQYFNSITPENELKYGRLIKDDLLTYDFSKADSIVDFAIKNNLRIRGHALVWGRAADFFKSPDLRSLLKDVPKTKMRDTLQTLISTHITTILTRYKGKISQWDCVNEPLEVFKGGFDQNIFFEHLGKEYIADAFRLAHQVDPTVELYLNEQFDAFDSAKAMAFIAFVEELVAQEVPIHGVGIQGHAMFTLPDIAPFKIFLQKIKSLGLKIEITELDARLRLFNDFEKPYEAQGLFYQNFASACIENPACQGITTWGTSDRYVWYDNMGIFKLHLPNQALPFDESMRPKPAYFGLVNALENK